MTTPHDPVTIPRSTVRPFNSSIVDQTYSLSIALPPGYAEANERYPVVYASPAIPDFYLLWPIIASMNFSKELPPVILVGIGYPVDDLHEIVLRRLRDHMPAPDEKMDQAMLASTTAEAVGIAEADNFLRFIREELKPFVHANYRSRPDDSTFAGFSSSALFGLYVLFNQPGTFHRYILSSPPIFRSSTAILTDERNYAAAHDDLAAHVFLAVGEIEEIDDPFPPIRPSQRFVSNLETLAKRLEERDYPGLELTTKVFAGETHLSVVPAAYSRGLREVFA